MMFESVPRHTKSINKQLREDTWIVLFFDFSVMVLKYISH